MMSYSMKELLDKYIAEIKKNIWNTFAGSDFVWLIRQRRF